MSGAKKRHVITLNQTSSRDVDIYSRIEFYSNFGNGRTANQARTIA
jgi:hypothetical protein